MADNSKMKRCNALLPFQTYTKVEGCTAYICSDLVRCGMICRCDISRDRYSNSQAHMECVDTKSGTGDCSENDGMPTTQESIDKDCSLEGKHKTSDTNSSKVRNNTTNDDTLRKSITIEVLHMDAINFYKTTEEIIEATGKKASFLCGTTLYCIKCAPGLYHKALEQNEEQLLPS